jgi:hypothetical protein
MANIAMSASQALASSKDVDLLSRKRDCLPVHPDQATLGYQGRFTVWTPDHVVLESEDDFKLSISKAALIHSRQVANDD